MSTSYLHDNESKDREAHDKYEKTKLSDPYPDIGPALLCAFDIVKYVTATGMISPFHDNPQQIKQAAYAVKMLGKCIYWDDDGKKQEFEIKEKDEFTLKRNSIAFVSLEPRFRIPYYMALRFNLQIAHIHRGILLGTGPLIDPGFDGKLAIPLHNLTMNDYVIRGGDDLIWIEFTKINIGKNLLDDKKLAEYVEFKPEKNISDINDYLHKAYYGHPIQSSLAEIRRFADQANKKSNVISWVGGLTAIALVLGILIPGWQLITDSNNYVKGAKESYKKIIEDRDEKIKELQNRILELERVNKAKNAHAK
jgi:deoxycytidine triphosphate deaminase